MNSKRLPYLLLASIFLAVATLPACAQRELQPDPGAAESRLILLGTAGGPGGYSAAAGIATLLVVGDTTYLVDAGESVSRQLAKVGFRDIEIDHVFVTHLHDDHIVGLPALASFAYTQRSPGLKIWGPPQTEAMVGGMLHYLDANAEIRSAERTLNKPSDVVSAEDVGTGLVFDDGQVRVYAVENTHFHISHPIASRNKSYSYRFELPDRTIFFTGDTGPSEAVNQAARGANILVAEMVSEEGINGVPPDVREHMLTEHLDATAVGEMAAAAGVDTVIVSHYRHFTDEDMQAIQAEFSGAVYRGNDLDEF